MFEFQPQNCTLYVAVDHHYLNKMLYTYPTWAHCHPEILKMQHLIIYDSKEVKPSDVRFVMLEAFRNFFARRELTAEEIHQLRPIQIVDWSMQDEFPDASQREEMLTGLVKCVSHIQTPWYLKLDADTYGTIPCNSFISSWFNPKWCFIAPPWGYTKPAGTIDKMNAWAKTVPELASYPDVKAEKVFLSPTKTKDVHPRMCSWVFFGNSEWCKWANSLCKEKRLPFPSQDTYFSYVQARTQAPWLSIKFKAFGWDHCKPFEKLKILCKNVLKDCPFDFSQLERIAQ